MHIRRRIVEDFAEYIDELGENGIKIPVSVRKFIEYRQDVEKMFDEGFEER